MKSACTASIMLSVPLYSVFIKWPTKTFKNSEDPLKRGKVYKINDTINLAKKKSKSFWRIWVSIPVTPACKAGSLPSELIPYNLLIREQKTHFPPTAILLS